jgi:hypothetical protein
VTRVTKLERELAAKLAVAERERGEAVKRLDFRAPATQEECAALCAKGTQWCHTCHIFECGDNMHPRTPTWPLAPPVEMPSILDVGPVQPVTPERHRLPDERHGTTRRFALRHPPRPHDCPSCGSRFEEPGQEARCYFTANRYPDGRCGEVFLVTDATGSMARGALDAVAMVISVALQFGIPLHVFLDKLAGTRFGVGGRTGDAQIPVCSSVLDLLARWMRAEFYPEVSK